MFFYHNSIVLQVGKKWEGYQRLQMIFDYADKPITSSDANAKYARESDMENRVAAVFAIIASKSPLSLFDNDYMKEYLALLDEKHTTPHRIERLRLIQVTMDLGKLEVARIMNVSTLHLPTSVYLISFELIHAPTVSLNCYTGQA